MLRERMETLVIAVSICVVSIIVLLAGMSLGAMRSNGDISIIQDEQSVIDTEDIIGTVISGFSVDTLAGEFANVSIMTWDEYYELSGISVKSQYKRGIYGKLDENSWDMEEAGLLALKEISSIENIDMNGMYLMMALSNATASQTTDIWRGYLCNFLAEEEVTASKKLEYYIQMNAYTGEVIRLEKKEGSGEARILLDTSNKVEVISNSIGIDYSAVPMYTLEEFFQLETPNYGVTSDAYRYGEEGYLSMEEAGNIVLKEIHRLFDEDMIGMKLVMSFSDGKWGGWLLNDYEPDSDLYKDYSFRMDARTGKIWWLTGGLRNMSYTTKESVTDVEIIENIRKIIQKYHLANVTHVDWGAVTVYNASKDMKSYFEKSEKQEGVRITNYVEFYTDEGELMRIDTDYETGELWQVLNKDYLYLYE